MKTSGNTFLLFGLFFLVGFFSGARIPAENEPRPNIILIMADDMGYECLSTYGSLSYNTPNLDALAENGIKFTQCVAQPLCTPSRVKIMTGLYNYRNYDYFEHLKSDQVTFGNLFREAGYRTCIAGKWQLNGRTNKNIFPDWDDQSKPNNFGFETYCLWQLTTKGSRYANPVIEQDGELLVTGKDDYGPDIFSEYILEFIEKNRSEPFFVYYPMVLTHAPFCPTPDSEAWKNPETRNQKDSIYFKDMVQYTDKIVGKITDKLADLNLNKNTLLIFTGDNGTHRSISTTTQSGIIRGGKGLTTDAGTHVPLVIYWPEMIREGLVFEGLIEFSDFFATFRNIVNADYTSDGHSFLPLLTGSFYEPRETTFVHYNRDPHNNKGNTSQFARTVDYKLYRDGKFYKLREDIMEQNPQDTTSLSTKELKIWNLLQKELDKHPHVTDFE